MRHAPGALAIAAGLSIAAPASAAVAFDQGMVSITIDDGWSSQWTHARGMLNQRGIKSTYYIVTDAVAQNWVGFLTLPQLRTLAKDGNEIGSHTLTYPDLTMVSDAELQRQLSQSKSWLLGNAGVSSVPEFAAPFGACDTRVSSAIKQFYASHRTVNTLQSWQDSDPQELGAFDCYNGITVAQVKSWIDQAVAQRSWLILLFHEFVPGAPVRSTDIRNSDFAAILDYLNPVTTVTVAQGRAQMHPAPPPPPFVGLPIYHDALESGFQDWSWAIHDLSPDGRRAQRTPRRVVRAGRLGGAGFPPPDAHRHHALHRTRILGQRWSERQPDGEPQALPWQPGEGQRPDLRSPGDAGGAEHLAARAPAVREPGHLPGIDDLYRLDALAGLKVFEVDHPATQADKRERVRALPPAKAEIVWTAVDFERDALGERLAAGGHDATKPTIWVWEGVVMYLADEAVRATLEAIRARSAAGSVLVLHYHEPSATRLTRGVRALLMSWIGEPQIGTRSRGATRELVERGGFRVATDLGTAEQAAQIGAGVGDNDLARVSRILVAHTR